MMISGTMRTRPGRGPSCAANVNAKDYLDTIPLHEAPEHNENAAVVQALLDAGADIEARNSDRNTPLGLALIEERSAVTRTLRENGAAEVTPVGPSYRGGCYSGLRLNPGDRCSGGGVTISITEGGCIGKAIVGNFSNDGTVCGPSLDFHGLEMSRSADGGAYTLDEVP